MNLQTIKDRTVEVGDCHIWQNATDANGYPIMKPPGKTCKLVRRLVFELAGGKLVYRKPIITTCGDKLCVNPDHLKASTTSKVAKAAAERGAWTSTTRAAKIATAKRKTAKITIDIAREIRNSTDTGPILAARYGIDRSLVNRIKKNLAWRDFHNPFMSLMV